MPRGDSRGSVEQLPSGSVRATWRAPDGTRQRRTFRDADDAALWLADQRLQVKRGQWAPPRPPAPILADYAAAWIAQRRNRHGEPLRPRTVEEYRRTFDRVIGPELGALPVDQITPARVRAWFAGLGERPAQQANAYGLLRAILGTAVDDDIVTRNPCRITGAGVKVRASSTAVLAPPEVDALMRAMPEHLRSLVLVAAWDGLRMGESFELRRQDVAPDGSLVTVSRGVTWTRGKTHRGRPKSRAGVRTVATPPHVAALLVAHLAVWTGPEADALVWTSTRGNQLRASTLYRHFYRARDVIGRPGLRWHDLRHTGATLAAQSGATLAELQARIGHSTVGAAMRYQHASSDRDRAIAERLTEAARPGLRAVQ